MTPLKWSRWLQQFGLVGGTALISITAFIILALIMAVIHFSGGQGLQIETFVAGGLITLLMVVPLAYLLMAALFHLGEAQIDLARKEGQVEYLKKIVTQASGSEKDQLISDLNSFAQTVAHDLKTPLTTILGFAAMLSDNQAKIPPDQQKEALQSIVKTSLKMNNIIQELLLLAAVRQSQVKTGPVSMANVVNAARQRLSSMVAEAGAELILPETSAWPKTLGYAPWIEEVWINYISNAIKYGGHPPRVELGVELDYGKSAAGRRLARFWVKDNGLGVAAEDVPQLFNQFTRLDQMRAEGHGLGLSIVARIMEKLGGEAGVETTPGKGSRFYFTLPILLTEPPTQARSKFPGRKK